MREARRLLSSVLPEWSKRLYRAATAPTRGPGFPWLCEHLSPAPGTIFDIGANVGDMTRTFALRFPAATIHAFEPHGPTFELLTANTRALGDRVHRHQVGFSSKDEERSMLPTSHHGANSFLPMSEDYQKVHPHLVALAPAQAKLVTMDRFVAEQGIGAIDLVKIDVEGFEQEVLAGGQRTLREKVGTVVMEMSMVRHGFDSSRWCDLTQTMLGLGFNLVAMLDSHYEASPEFGLRLYQFDAVFARKGTVALRPKVA